MSIEPVVETTLSELFLDPRDAAAGQLALLYARRLDTAAVVAAAADKALRAAEKTGDDALVEQVSALKAKLSEQVALRELGARLEAVLDALGATPKSRAKATAPAKRKPNLLDEMRNS